MRTKDKSALGVYPDIADAFEKADNAMEERYAKQPFRIRARGIPISI